MRIYLPSTLSALAAVLRTGQVTAPACAFTVTPTLREWYASGDMEELEYAAMSAAARASLRLLAADPQAPSRPPSRWKKSCPRTSMAPRR